MSANILIIIIEQHYQFGQTKTVEYEYWYKFVLYHFHFPTSLHVLMAELGPIPQC